MLLPHIDALASHAPPDAGTETTAFLLNQAGVFSGDHGQVGPERVSRHVQETLAAAATSPSPTRLRVDPGRAILLMPG
jgi:hypothetical protein